MPSSIQWCSDSWSGNAVCTISWVITQSTWSSSAVACSPTSIRVRAPPPAQVVPLSTPERPATGSIMIR